MFRQIVVAWMLMVCLIPTLWEHASAADLGAGKLGAELALAAKKGDLEAVRKFLDRGVDIEAEGEEMGSTALNAACFWGHLDIVRLLLARGANIEARNKCGLTPLISAALTERPEFVQLLVDKGVDVNVEGGIGRPALYFAIEKLDETGKYDGQGYRVADILLKNGADVEGGEHWAYTPLMLAVTNGKKDIVGLLLKHGAKVNDKKYYLSSPLHVAAANGDKVIFDLLVVKGANIHARSVQGDTVLHSAALGKNADIIKWLLAKGLDIHAREKTGWTPLSCAAQTGSVAVLKLLFANGAGVNQVDSYSQTPLFYAAMYGHAGAVAFLLEKGAQKDARSKAEKISIEMFRNMDGFDGDTVAGREAMVVYQDGIAGYTPLAVAAVKRHKEVMAVLLTAGADVNARCRRGNTPLGIAAMRGHVSVVRMLLENGAKVDNRDIDGNTPLMMAACNGHPEVVRELIRSKADLAIRNLNGQTALIMAKDDAVREIIMAGGGDEKGVGKD